MEIKIIKRNGQEEIFKQQKIKDAIKKAFRSVNKEPNRRLIEEATGKIEKEVVYYHEQGKLLSVEEIQDHVEIALIDLQCHDVLKSYILYRNKHQRMRYAIENFDKLGYDIEIIEILRDIQSSYDEKYNLNHLYHKMVSFYKDSMDKNELLDILIRASLELTTSEAPDWEYISSRFLRYKIGLEIKETNDKNQIRTFYDKLKIYTEQGFYGTYILDNYAKEDVEKIEGFIDNRRDQLLTYSSLILLYKRYLLKTFDNEVFETPQEMFLGIAMHLGIAEKQNRLDFVEDFYDIISTLQITMATPTMSNARKPHHQLSSCFIDTVGDSLNGIYKSIDNFAKVSKSGGGMGLYFGKVRANGSDIRGFKGVAGGVLRWIKLANDTAVAVDQLGVRQGAVACYLDAWHSDLPEFLQLRTNNGDDRMKAHDIFPGICYPDLFWKQAKEDLNQNWYMMDPHEILVTKGYALEDYYGKEWEDRYFDCVYDKRITKREILIKDLVRMIIKSAVETGTPFTFNRDTVNNTNPNKDKGVIYASNLCTEILQNMKAIEMYEPEFVEIDGEQIVVEKSKPGEFVVCNLASLVLGNIDLDNDEKLRHVIRTVTRALDNVIDLNYYALPYAKHTNAEYRAIGLGASGYHHMLVQKGIRWESKEHIEYVDRLFERINFYTIEASADLAKEKGQYNLYKGSEWSDGSYFDQRDYNSDEWKRLKNKVMEQGMRNAYLLAIAPTGSTSIIAGTTAGIDPIMHKYYLEEKKGDIVPRVAPGLNEETFWLYKSAHTIDQSWSLKAAGARQKHIDQSQSLNLYITTEFTMRQILDLYIEAWEEGVKTLYYVRSKSLEVEECESCAG